jgi:hypothetical protein
MTQDNSSYDKYGRHGLLGEDSIDGGTEQVFVEPDIKALRITMWSWNTDTLSWERYTGAAGQTATEFKDSRAEYDSEGRIIYSGRNATYDAPTSSATWLVIKVEYDTDGNITRAVERTTSWDARGV